MKKSVSQFLAAALISTAVLSPALKADATNASFGGLQLGLVGGLSFINGHTSDMKSKFVTGGAQAYSPSSMPVWNLGGRGGAFGLFLGYGAVVGQVYVGADVVYTRDFGKSDFREQSDNLSTRALGDIHPGATVTLKLKDSVELAARFGVPIGNWMPYVRLGWTSSKVVGTYNCSHPWLTVKQPEQKFLDKHVSGIVVAAGSEGHFQCVVIGVEGGYKRYFGSQMDKVTCPGRVDAAGVPVPNMGITREAKVSLSGSYVRVKLGYRFSL